MLTNEPSNLTAANTAMWYDTTTMPAWRKDS